MATPDPSDICSPIKDLSEVLTWTCDGKCWIHKHNVIDLRKRTSYLCSGYVLDTRGKDDVYSEYKLPSDMLSKTLICHDYKGGYVEDRYCNGTSEINTYRFFNWAAIDIYVYFSHNLVTIPTHGWLNAGHLHGVPVLGTLITEWHDGEAVWRRVLTDVEKTQLFSKKLAEICGHYKFDGYLLNVENVIPKDYIPRLIQFIRLLKSHLELYCQRPTWLIWYDSVTINGTLDWQNKLCPLNKPFFDVCDGIFLNYVWKPVDLKESLELAGSRRTDVFVGVDVFGRNCYQNGGFNTDKAVSVIRDFNMSVAIFAMGWTFEHMTPEEKFLTRETVFWKKFWSYLHTHGPASLPFKTNFCQGISFDKNSGAPWFNLAMQEYQPTSQPCAAEPASQESCVSLYLNDGILFNGASLKVQTVSEQHSKMFHRVFTCDFSGKTDKTMSLMVTLALKNQRLDPESKFRIYFVLEDWLSIEGQASVSMRTRPKGYRAFTKLGDFIVSGSLIDFTSQRQTDRPKIKVYHSSLEAPTPVPAPWHQIKFLLELDAMTSLTEILVLPAPKGSILWGELRIEPSDIPVVINPSV